MKFSRSAAVLSIVAAVALVVGSCGTWVKAGDITKGGLEADGSITLVLAILAGGFAAATFTPPAVARVMRWFVLPFGLLALLIAIIDVADVNSKLGDFGDVLEAGVGWGLWLTLIASIVLCLGGIGLMIGPMPKPAAPPPFVGGPPPAQYPPGQYPPAQYPPAQYPGQTPPPPPPA